MFLKYYIRKINIKNSSFQVYIKSRFTKSIPPPLPQAKSEVTLLCNLTKKNEFKNCGIMVTIYKLLQNQLLKHFVAEISFITYIDVSFFFCKFMLMTHIFFLK